MCWSYIQLADFSENCDMLLQIPSQHVLVVYGSLDMPTFKARLFSDQVCLGEPSNAAADSITACVSCPR